MSLSVRVLGALAVEIDSAPQPLQRKPLDLLSLLLAARGRSASPSWLIDQLWSGEPPRSAQSALRVYLTKLRGALEPDRQAAPSSRLGRSARGWLIRLDDDELDVAAYESTVAEARVLVDQGRDDEAWTIAQTGHGLWKGAPYPDVDLDAVNRERDRLSALHRQASAVRYDLAIDRGHPELVLDELDADANTSPYDEAVAIVRARALYLAGRQVDALAELRMFRRRLDEELGLESGSAVIDMEQRILRHDPALAPRARTSVAVAPAARLLGRDDLITRIEAELQTHRVVVLVGEAGIGKTTLVSALAPAMPVARATCAATAPPLGVIRDLVASLPTPPADHDAWSRFRAALDPSGASSDDPVAVALLGEDLLVGAVDATGLVAIVDDAHMIDSASALVLAHVLGARAALRLILAKRPGRVASERDAMIARALVIEVPPLSRETSRQLLSRLRTRHPVKPTTSDTAALEGAEGNPWLIELAASGSHAAIGRRLTSDLSTEARELALQLAILSTDVPVRSAIALGGESATEELLVTGIARLTGDERLRLRHQLLSDDLRRLAGRSHCAEAAATLVRGAPGSELSALAVRSAVAIAGSALSNEEVASWAVQAGQQALDSGGLDDAAALFGQAIDCAAADAGIAARAHLGRGLALAAAGRLGAARPVFLTAMQRAQEAGVDLLVKDATVGLLGMLTPAHAEAAVVESITGWLLSRDRLADVDALEILDARVAAACDVDLAIVEARTVDLFERCDQVGSPLAALYRLIGAWRLSQERGEPSGRRLATGASAVGLAEQLAVTDLLVRALRHHIDDLVAAGLPDRAMAARARLSELANRGRIAEARWWVDLLVAADRIRSGASDGLDAAAAVHAAWDRLQTLERDDAFMIQTMVVLYQEHRFDDLLAAINQAIQARAGSPASLLIPAARVAALAERGDDVDAVSASIDELAGRMREKKASWLDPPSWYLLARAAIAVGRTDQRITDALEPHRGSWMLVGTALATLGPVDAVLAGHARLQGLSKSADNLLNSAILLADRMGAPAWEADTMRLDQLARQGVSSR